MNPITHLLVSWSAAEASGLDSRDRAIVAWVGLAPDLDGFGAIPDLVARGFGYPDPALFGQFHHVLLHGAFGALLLAAVGALGARRRLPAFLWGLLTVHLHLLCDLLGSRGPTPDDIWPVPYLGPFSEKLTLAWSGQWPLNAWQNIAVTLGLIAFVFVRAATRGHSPVALFGARANEAFVSTVRARWEKVKRGGPRG